MRRFAGQALLIGWTVLALGPFLLILLLSLRDNADIFSHPLGLGGSYHPGNFRTAWDGPIGSAGMGTFLRNSLIALLASLIVNLGLGAPGAYFATRLSRRAARGYLAVFLAGSVVPIVLLLVPSYHAFNSLQLLNSPWALGAVYGVLALPTTVLILHAYFVDFPRELVEAATIDGLGDYGAFLRIVLPLSRGALTAVSLLLAVWVWSETQLAIVLLQDPAAQTASVGILGFQGQFTSDLGALFAGLTIIALPVVVVYLVFHRAVARGVTLGGAPR